MLKMTGTDGCIKEISQADICKMFPRGKEDLPPCIDRAFVYHKTGSVVGIVNLHQKHHCLKNRLPFQEALLSFWSHAMIIECGKILAWESIRHNFEYINLKVCCPREDYRKKDADLPIYPQEQLQVEASIISAVKTTEYLEFELAGKIILADGRIAVRKDFLIHNPLIQEQRSDYGNYGESRSTGIPLHQ